MIGLPTLAILIVISFLPVIPVYIWFRVTRFPVSVRRFALFTVAGMAALIPAALIQAAIPVSSVRTGANILFAVFIRVALSEELSKLLVLILFLVILRFSQKRTSNSVSVAASSFSKPSLCAAYGLLTGLGFGFIESAAYGSFNFNAALIRAVTASPLHAACGIRLGFACSSFAADKRRAVYRFFTAVAIHGCYNLMILNTHIPRPLPIILAYAALVSGIVMIREQQKIDDFPYSQNHERRGEDIEV